MPRDDASPEGPRDPEAPADPAETRAPSAGGDTNGGGRGAAGGEGTAGHRSRHGLRTSGDLSPQTFAKLSAHLASLDEPGDPDAGSEPDASAPGYGFAVPSPSGSAGRQPAGMNAGTPVQSARPSAQELWAGAPAAAAGAPSRPSQRSKGDRPREPIGTIDPAAGGRLGGSGGSGSGHGSGYGSGGGRGGSSGRRRSSRRRRRRREQLFRRRSRARRIAIWCSLALGALLIVGLVVVGDAYYQAFRAYDSLKGVPSLVEKARKSLESGQLPESTAIQQASSSVGEAQLRLEQGGFPVRFVRSIPLLGTPVKAITLATSAADKETHAALVVSTMIDRILGPDPGGGGPAPVFHNGVVDVALLQSATPQLQLIVNDLRQADAEIRAIPNVPFVGKLTSLKTQVETQSAQAIALGQRALAAFRLLPEFFGADTPKTYYLALQNNDDQRGTGGAVLAYALIRIDNGRITQVLNPAPGPITNIDSNTKGINTPVPPSAAWYLRETGVLHRLANGANYSPDFPSAAKAWKGMLASKGIGARVDGVIAMDPFAVAAFIADQKQIEVDGNVITPQNLVQFVMSTQYTLDRGVQRDVPAELIASAYQSITDPQHLFGLMKNVGTALTSKHIQIWSADPQVQALVTSLGWDGAVQNRAGGDYLNLAYEKRIGNKVDYYMKQAATYDVTVQDSGAVRSTYAVNLSLSSMPQGLPEAIAGHQTPYGADLAMLNLYVPGSSRFVSVSPSGPFPADAIQPSRYSQYVEPKGFVQHVETDAGGRFRVLTQTVLVDPAHDATVRYAYTVPGVIKDTPEGKVYTLTVQHQPMVNPQQLQVVLHLPNGSTVVSAPPGWITTVRGDTVTIRYSGPVTADFTASVVFR